MAASLRKALNLRALKSIDSQLVRPSFHRQLICPSQKICSSVVLPAQFSDVQRQQTKASNISFQRPEEVLSIVDVALQHEDYFNVKELVTLQDLFNARVHLGHNSGLQHVSMSPFIFGTRQGMDIIDLEQTIQLLHHALNVCAHIVYRGGMVLFFSRNMQVLPWVERMAKEVGEYAHCRPWKKGTFTDAVNAFGTLPIYPELCVFFNTQDTVFDVHRAVIESAKLLIPTVGIVDTNCDITQVAYPIPANDDSPASQHLFIDLFKKTVLRAKERRKEDGVDIIHNIIEES